MTVGGSNNGGRYRNPKLVRQVNKRSTGYSVYIIYILLLLVVLTDEGTCTPYAYEAIVLEALLDG